MRKARAALRRCAANLVAAKAVTFMDEHCLEQYEFVPEEYGADPRQT